jgi:hypothetical protein
MKKNYIEDRDDDLEEFKESYSRRSFDMRMFEV